MRPVRWGKWQKNFSFPVFKLDWQLSGFFLSFFKWGQCGFIKGLGRWILELEFIIFRVLGSQISPGYWNSGQFHCHGHNSCKNVALWHVPQNVSESWSIIAQNQFSLTKTYHCTLFDIQLRGVQPKFKFCFIWTKAKKVMRVVSWNP